MHNGNAICQHEIQHVDFDNHAFSKQTNFKTCHVEHQLTLVRGRCRN